MPKTKRRTSTKPSKTAKSKKSNEKIVVEVNTMKTNFKIGSGVQWHDNGLRFGWLKEIGYKWAKVQHPVWGKCKVRVDELIKYQK